MEGHPTTTTSALWREEGGSKQKRKNKENKHQTREGKQPLSMRCAKRDGERERERQLNHGEIIVCSLLFCFGELLLIERSCSHLPYSFLKWLFYLLLPVCIPSKIKIITTSLSVFFATQKTKFEKKNNKGC